MTSSNINGLWASRPHLYQRGRLMSLISTTIHSPPTDPRVPLETATYLSDLVTSNPAASDPLSNADDHLRLLKATAKATLAHTGPLTNSDNQLIPAAGTSAKPAYSFAAEPTLGFYRSAAGVITLAGGRLAGGVEAGTVQMFLVAPASLGTATAHTGREWLELNGASYNVADYPALAAKLGVGSGTFTVLDMYTAGRFPRSRTAAVTVGTAQADTVGAHTHPDVTPTTAAETQEHTHTFSGTTGTDSPDHTHTSTNGAGSNSGSGVTGGGSFTLNTNPQNVTSGGANQRHSHSFSGTTSGRSATHNHTVTVSTPANTGTTETRPVAMTFVFAVKT